MKKTKGNKPGRNRKQARKLPSKSATFAGPQGILFKALPSDGQVRMKIASDGQPSPVYPGRISLTDQMSAHLERMGRSYWHPSKEPLAQAKPSWIINYQTDPDHYAHALEHLDQALKARPVPVFNHPFAILKTRRNLIWRELQNIPNLIAPKCERFTPTNPNHFPAAFQRGGFEYPVIIRPVGSHTGIDLIFIGSENDWPKVYQIPWGGREIYMTQWVDFQSSAGEWRKLRLCLTPNRIGLRHILYGEGWMIHAMKRNAAEADREIEFLERQDSWTALQDVGRAIRERIGLDFCGVDLGYKSDGEFVLFEANASMSMLSRAHTPEHRRENYYANLERLNKDVWSAIERVTSLEKAPS